MNEGQDPKSSEALPAIPLQQTKLWQNLQQDLGETTFFLTDYSSDTSPENNNPSSTSAPENYSGTTSPENYNYQMLIIKKSTPAGPYFYLPYGPYLRDKTAAKPAYEALQALEKRERVIFTRIEPQSPENASYWLEQKSAKKSKDLNPKETWVLDLTPSLDEIYHGMKQGTRTRSKNYQNRGVSVEKYLARPEYLAKNQASSSSLPVSLDETGEKLKILMTFLQKIANSRHFSPVEQAYLEKEFAQSFCSLLISYYDPKKDQNLANSPENAPDDQKSTEKIPISASLFFDDDTTRYYMQSGADPEYKKLPGTNALLIEAIKDAKEKGLKFFDFWGIAPENAPSSHPWAGFTQFKKSFGGFEKSYAGTYDLVRKPLKYRLYNSLRRLNRFFRKLK